MGWLADRIGVRNSVLIGTVMVALGLALPRPDKSGRSMSGMAC
jgi:dipeptide/tripeptide permease